MVKTEEQKHGSAQAVHLQIPGKNLQGRKMPEAVRMQVNSAVTIGDSHEALLKKALFNKFTSIVPLSSDPLAVTLYNGMEKASSTVSEQHVLVGLKAVNRICEQWGLSIEESANLVDMSLSTWKRARKPTYSGKLSKDQVLRLSAIVGIYKALNLYFDDKIAHSWIKLSNGGPLCRGARPIDVLIEGGLPALLRVRQYLDALRGGS